MNLVTLRKRYATALRNFSGNTEIAKRGHKNWQVVFKTGNQSFNISLPTETKAEAEWMQIMFCVALENLRQDDL